MTRDAQVGPADTLIRLTTEKAKLTQELLTEREAVGLLCKKITQYEGVLTDMLEMLEEVADEQYERDMESIRRARALLAYHTEPDNEVQVAKNCANWAAGYCGICGTQSPRKEVSADYKCPYWRPRL